jgi:hypothetical protein
MADSMERSSCGSASSRAERLTETPTGGASGAARCQAAAALLACSSTQRPIGRISLDSSATGMNPAGGISPRRGWRQRSSASSITIEPSVRSMIGW